MAEIEALDGLGVEDAVLRLGRLSDAAYAEQKHFELYLERDGRRSDGPIFRGLCSAGRAAQHIPGWIDGHYGGIAGFGGEPRRLDRDGFDLALFRSIGGVIAPGGWLGLAYETLGADTPLLGETRRELDLGAPAAATPLGLLLHAAGCGLHIRNWYISEGWREGPRKLQGYRPAHEESRRTHLERTVGELRAFLAGADRPELAAARARAGRLLESLA